MAVAAAVKAKQAEELAAAQKETEDAKQLASHDQKQGTKGRAVYFLSVDLLYVDRMQLSSWHLRVFELYY